jgi:lysine 2,3-aminomutase
VLDIPGGHGKTPIGPCGLTEAEDGSYRVADFNDGSHAYTDTSLSDR